MIGKAGESTRTEKGFPALGLTIKEKCSVYSEFDNPFKFHRKNEYLFMAREKKRQSIALKKYDKDSVHVWDHEIVTRPNRAGMFRDLEAIPPLPREEKEGLRGYDLQQKKIEDREKYLELKHAQVEEDQSELALVREDSSGLELDVYSDQEEEILAIEEDKAKTKNPLAYLQHTVKKEPITEYVNNIRMILLAEKAIGDKNEETKRMREFIQLKEAKLEVAKRKFKKDCERLTTYLNSIQKDATEEAQRANEKVAERVNMEEKKKNLQADLQRLSKDIEKKLDDVKMLNERKSFVEKLYLAEEMKKLNEVTARRNKNIEERKRNSKAGQAEPRAGRPRFFVTQDHSAAGEKQDKKKKSSILIEGGYKKYKVKCDKRNLSKYDSEDEFEVFFQNTDDFLQLIQDIEHKNLNYIDVAQEKEFQLEILKKEQKEELEKSVKTKEGLRTVVEDLKVQLEIKKQLLKDIKFRLNEESTYNKEGEGSKRGDGGKAIFAELSSREKKSALKKLIERVYDQCMKEQSGKPNMLEMLQKIENYIDENIEIRDSIYTGRFHSKLLKAEEYNEQEKAKARIEAKNKEEERLRLEKKLDLELRAKKKIIRVMGKDMMSRKGPAAEKPEKKAVVVQDDEQEKRRKYFVTD